ncbi:general odorant-binding protein 56d [Drosophila erecta]|uniref:Odorant-binding protein 56e n=1 Tax=Drosophila erecta TaxID=7220 RepID=B3NJT5_DROER|nr:general odorant-binding protein 56d [Drosophila erecta]EDV55250.1 Odorant-binding protein 56e [Drosophila erecta]
MKVFLVFAALAALSVASAVGLTDSQKAEGKLRAQACAKQEGITKEQALALRSGNFADSDPKVKCFANCFLEQSGFLANGQLKPDVVLAKLGPIAGEARLKEVQAKCDSIKGTDKCDTGYKLYKCYSENRAQI